jgi:hypothetical protein
MARITTRVKDGYEVAAVHRIKLKAPNSREHPTCEHALIFGPGFLIGTGVSLNVFIRELRYRRHAPTRRGLRLGLGARILTILYFGGCVLGTATSVGER